MEDAPYNFLITDYKYDSLYRVIKVKTPNAKIIYYSYDGYGRQSKRITPDAGQTVYIYDDMSNLTYTQDANQHLINNQKYTFRNYDGLNRLTGIGEDIFENDSPSDGSQNNNSNDESYLTVNVYDTISNSVVNSLFFSFPEYSPQFTKGNLAATAYRTKTSDHWNYKYYRYDERKRVIKMWNIIADFDTLITDYYYNSQDQIILYSHTGMGESKTYRNTYDYTGRLAKVDYLIGSPDAIDPDLINLAEYGYNDNSQVNSQRYNDYSLENTYEYNNRNWISDMNNSGNLFNYDNTYFKNGNVKTQNISGDYNKNMGDNSELNFSYTYDKSNRLLSSYTSGNIFKLTNTYDKDGNISTLNRKGNAGNLIDSFTYDYYSGTNKLLNVRDGKEQFFYDANGNMTADSLNNNINIKYDYRNLIIQLKHMEFPPDSDTMKYVTNYLYDEAGNRIRKSVYKFIGTTYAQEIAQDFSNDSLWENYNDEIYSRDVSGKELAIYKNGDILEYPVYGLDLIGKIKNDEMYYYFKDHLGSVRATLNPSGDIVSAQDYDAWGYLLQDRTYDSDDSKFKFTGKERDVESDYDYFGARYYDARIGRWGSIDPRSDQRMGITPYNFVQDNPLKYIDPNGALDRPIYNTWGMFLGTDDEGLQGDPLIMNSENFKQGMSAEDALSNNLGYEGLNGTDAQIKLTEHYNGLKVRPDYDGYLTLDEANEWYRSGNGQSLFTSLEKIDLSGILSLGESYVGEINSYNLLLNSSSLNDGLVYGSITLKRYPNNQVRAYADKYSFEMHDPNNPSNWLRNGATVLGQKIAGEGIIYDINIYGSKNLTPILPWIK